ncbi:MAG: hypothetical protein C0417_13250 [Chlorobiaceae bacterium]|nr:hypothetical protein [Chlorobiaceae bacterium]
MITKYFSILMITILLFSHITFAQKIIVSTFGNNFSGVTIYKYDIETKEKKAVYTTDQNHVFIDHKIKLSPDGFYIAAILHDIEFYKDINQAFYQKDDLLILKLDGTICAKMSEVQLFDWSKDTHKIVYVTGLRYEGKPFTKADRLWILDLKTGRKRDLGKCNEIDIHWAQFDGMIYTTDLTKVYQYNPEKGYRKITPYKAIYFSPYGEYSYQPNYEGTGFKLFETISNRDITPNNIKKENVNFYRWIGKDELVAGDVTLEKYIIDVQTGRTKNIFTGNMIGYNDKTSEIYVHKDKKVFKELPDSKIEKIKIDKR